MAQDLYPLKHIKPARTAIALGLWEGPKGHVNTRRFFNKRSIHLARKIKCNIGAWHITKRYNHGGGPKIADIKHVICLKVGQHKPAMIERLKLMGAGGRLSKLMPTQYKSFYNFLTNLE